MIPSRLVLGGAADIELEGTSGDLKLDGGKLYPDKDDTDTYIYQDAADKIKLVAGAVTMIDIVEAATDYIEVPQAALVQWASSVKLSAATDGKLVATNAAGQGVAFDLTTNSKLLVTDEAAGALTLEANLLNSVTGTLNIPLTDLRVHDAMTGILPATAGNDDMSIVDDVSALMTVVGVAATGASQTQYAAFQFMIPEWYKAGGTVTLRVRAKEDVGAATVDTTLDVEAFTVGDDDAISVDHCETAAQSLTTSYANYDFVLDDDDTGEAFAAGDLVQVRLTSVTNDTGGAVGTVFTANRISVIFSA